LCLIGFLSGCATYKFQKPATSGGQGFIACYDGKPILEYTVGKDKSLPDLTLAKERFNRRRSTVEYYYKQMGQIESRLKGLFWDPPAMVIDFIGGILRWPFIASADYKYNHNSKYRAKVDRLDEEKDELEIARISKLKKELGAYIAKDIAEESGGRGVVENALSQSLPEPELLPPDKREPVKTEMPLPIVEPSVPEIVPAPVMIKEAPASLPVVEPVLPATVEPESKIEPVVFKDKPLPALRSAVPVAVIMAKPIKGYSPLKVNFSGQKSYSKSGRIVSYLWDFGDGDTSTKKNPENTYLSTTFGSRNFTVTLTVKDETGSTSSATSNIEVMTQ